jgi:hypothetical protein
MYGKQITTRVAQDPDPWDRDVPDDWAVFRA